MFQQNTENIPKIRAKALMGDIGLNISDFTFGAVQKIGDCFVIPEATVVEKIKEK